MHAIKKIKQSFLNLLELLNSEVKLVFIGVVTPLTYSKTYLSNLKESEGTPIYNFFSDKEEIYSSIQEEADDFKNIKKVDYVILYWHMSEWIKKNINEILSNVQNIDAVFDGHTHDEYNTTTKDNTNKDIPLSKLVQNFTTLVN